MDWIMMNILITLTNVLLICLVWPDGVIYVSGVLESGCSPQYNQVCRNCKPSSGCQATHNSAYVLSQTACMTMTPTSFQPNMRFYEWKTAKCSDVNCSFIEQDMFTEMYRTGCAPDCQYYRIYEVAMFEGTCPILRHDTGDVSYDYCKQQCLSLLNCRAVTFKAGECFYHNCTARSPSSSQSTFFTRICEAAIEPTAQIVQTCLNCNLSCGNNTAVSVTIDIHTSTRCGLPTGTIVAVMYKPPEHECTKWTCDVPTPGGAGSVVMRITNTRDCPEFHMIKVKGSPGCEVLAYVEGIIDDNYCMRLCMDTTGCRSVVLPIINDRNCSMYPCANINTGTRNMYLRLCKEECQDTTFQVCQNCGTGPECPTNFNTMSNACDEYCGPVEFCDGFSVTMSADTTYGGGGHGGIGPGPGSSVCLFYECTEVIPSNTSMFKRKTCTTDCPLFMMYTLTNHVGSCEVIRTEQEATFPYMCFDRCLDDPQCRAVTHNAVTNRCQYHTCDSAVPIQGSGQTLFLWQYCLDAIPDPALDPFVGIHATNYSMSSTTSTSPETTTSSTIITSTPSTTPSTTTTSTTTTSSTTTTPTKTIPVTTTTSTTTTTKTLLMTKQTFTDKRENKKPKPKSIFLMPCICSTGVFANKTSIEVAIELKRNLTVRKDDLSATVRKLKSIYDARVSARNLGGAGVIFIAVIVVILALTDLRLIFRHLYRLD